MSLWIRYDPSRSVWEVSPNERENYFSDLIEHHPRETRFSKWIEFDAFVDAKTKGVYDQPGEPSGNRGVRIFDDGDFLREVKKRRGGTDVWGPHQINVPPPVAPGGKARIYFDQISSTLKASENGGPWGNLFTGTRWCRLSRDSVQSIPNTTITPIQFNVELFDPGAMHDFADNTKIIFPVSGVYLIGGSFSFEASTAGTYRYAYLNYNNSKFITIQNTLFNANQTFLICVTLRYFNAGDYVTFNAHQDTGGGLNVTQDPNHEYSPIFWAAQLA